MNVIFLYSDVSVVVAVVGIFNKFVRLNSARHAIHVKCVADLSKKKEAGNGVRV
jgi:hypothetical protein